jgi:hypothetical protein
VRLYSGFPWLLGCQDSSCDTPDLQNYRPSYTVENYEMQVKAAEAKAADLATKNQKLIEELTQANILNENLPKLGARPKSPRTKWCCGASLSAVK